MVSEGGEEGGAVAIGIGDRLCFRCVGIEVPGLPMEGEDVFAGEAGFVQDQTAIDFRLSGEHGREGLKGDAAGHIHVGLGANVGGGSLLRWFSGVYGHVGRNGRRLRCGGQQLCAALIDDEVEDR